MFWFDPWSGNSALCERFERLFQISENKNAFVADLGSWSNGRWVWNLTWRRTFFVWEEDLLSELMSISEVLDIKEHFEDAWSWNYTSDGLYSSKSAYLRISKQSQALTNSWDAPSNAFFERFWSNNIPSKVLTFSWQMILERIPTLSNLARRNIVENQNLVCVLCNQGTETASLLFFNCSFAFMVWGKVYSCLGFQVTFPVESKLHFKSHLELMRRKKLKKIWMIPWFATV